MGADRCQPLIALLHFSGLQDDLAIAICLAGKMFVQNTVAFGSLDSFGAVTEEIYGYVVQRLAVDRIGQVIQHLFVQGLFYDGGIADPDYNSRRVAVLQPGHQ